jgi:hypothetical protein
VGVLDGAQDCHGAADMRLYAFQRVNGNGWLPVRRQEPVFLLIHDLNDEQLFALLAMAWCEELVIYEAFVIFTALGYLE